MHKPKNNVYIVDTGTIVTRVLHSAKLRYGDRILDYITAKMLHQLIYGYTNFELGIRMNWCDITNEASMILEEAVLGRTPWWNSPSRDDIYSRYIDPLYSFVLQSLDNIPVEHGTMDAYEVVGLNQMSSTMRIVNHGDFRANVWYRIFKNKKGHSYTVWSHQQGLFGYEIREDYKIPEL